MKTFNFNRITLILVILVLGSALIWVRSARLMKGTAQRQVRTIHVLAAASLSESFTQIGKLFESDYPGVHVAFNFAGSQELALQIEQGAPADVFASADTRWMDEIEHRGLAASTPEVFVHNRLIVIIPRANPAEIRTLSDLAKPGIKIVLAAESVPAGRYSREVLDRLSRGGGLPSDFTDEVMRNVVSREENVKAVVGKIVLNEADAGLVYRSDVTPSVSPRVQTLGIPEGDNVTASYPIVWLKNSTDSQAAAAFVRWVLAASGQRILANYNFIPVMNGQ